MSNKQWGHGFASGFDDATKKDADTLCGRYFHSYYTEGDNLGDIKCQGQIVGRAGGKYVIQLFSWIDGCPTIQKIVGIEEIAEWTLYDSDDDWRNAGSEFNRRKLIELGVRI